MSYKEDYHMKDALQHWLRKSGMEQQHAVHRIHQEWAAIVGEPIAQQTQSLKFENGVLTIQVQSAAWRQELTMAREKLCQRINDYLGLHAVDDIQVR